jgi:toxin ParE2
LPTARPLNFYHRAIQEARQAFRWYARRSPQAAAHFRARFTQALDDIQENPERWPVYIEGTRVVLRKFPYLIIFRASEDVIDIVAVAHGHRRPAYWRRRKE